MTGLTNYSADNLLNYITGQIPMPGTTVVPAIFVALFTAVGTDAGTGFTEVASGAYARQQVAGTLAAGAAFTTSSTSFALSATAPAWLLALGTNGSGVSVYDITAGAFIGTVASISGATVTLSAAAAHASSGSADSLTFSAFGNGSGTSPSSTTNGAAVAYPAATASWGTVLAWGLYDAVTAGDLLAWDFLGNYQWLPFEVAAGTGPTWNVKGNAYVSNDPVVVTAEYGGTLPSASTGTFTGYAVNYVASPATDSILVDTASGPATPCVLTASGSGMIRKIVEQSIPSGITASFAASTLTLSAA